MTRSLHSVLLASAVVVGVFCLTVLAYVGMTFPKTGSGMGPRAVPPGEVRLRFRQVTGLRLPKSANNVRALVDSGRATAIFVRVEADRAGQDEIVMALAGAGVVPRALEPHEVDALRQPSSAFFGQVVAWQSEQGVRLYEPAAIRAAHVLEGQVTLAPSAPGQPGDILPYKMLIDDESGVVYLLVGKGSTETEGPGGV